MKKLILDRSAYTENGTYGIFSYMYKAICVSLELPWRDNKIDISCIPTGGYVCTYNKSINKIIIHNVPGRTNIQIHIGNFLTDILGCILAGSEFNYSDVRGIMVYNSKKAFTKIVSYMKLSDNEKFLLKIKD